MKETSTPTKEKHDTVNRFLFDEYVLVHLTPSSAGVVLPDHLASQPMVTLKLSKLFRGSMSVEADKVVAELLFGGTYHTCVIPFEAIWGVTTVKGKNIIWPESAPAEVIKSLAERKDTVPEEAPKFKTRGHLKRVK